MFWNITLIPLSDDDVKEIGELLANNDTINE
jgi:hypothetical protein